LNSNSLCLFSLQFAVAAIFLSACAFYSVAADSPTWPYARPTTTAAPRYRAPQAAAADSSSEETQEVKFSGVIPTAPLQISDFQFPGLENLIKLSNRFAPSAESQAQVDAMLKSFNEDTAPVLQGTLQEALYHLTKLTETATPMLRELTYATIPMMTRYTEDLREYNAEGGSFPEAPEELRTASNDFSETLSKMLPQLLPLLTGLIPRNL